LQSIILALFLILAYVTFRFEFRWAVAAVIALIHDVVVTVGALSLTNREISLTVIAALLTIVGFSLNDTIVIFDRVRENLRVPTKEPFDRVLNRSINQTLMRTIITSGTVLLTVLALLFFGGEVLNDFAFAMTIGVISGTYSTVYVATAVVMWWEQKWPRRAKIAKVPGPDARPPRAPKKREREEAVKV
jgi:preprotein translocase SecF subunit